MDGENFEFQKQKAGEAARKKFYQPFNRFFAGVGGCCVELFGFNLSQIGYYSLPNGPGIFGLHLELKFKCCQKE